jgi:hypothetical protein
MTQWRESEAPEAEGEAPGMPDGQRRRKSLTIDLIARLPGGVGLIHSCFVGRGLPVCDLILRRSVERRGNPR